MDDKTMSDGSTASYYELPAGATQLQDLISARDMNAQVGEIFRACYRYGRAAHSDRLRDARKILFYADAEVRRLMGTTPTAEESEDDNPHCHTMEQGPTIDMFGDGVEDLEEELRDLRVRYNKLTCTLEAARHFADFETQHLLREQCMAYLRTRRVLERRIELMKPASGQSKFTRADIADGYGDSDD